MCPTLYVIIKYVYLQHDGPELEKVPSSASVLVRKDFGIRRNLRKAPGGKKIGKGKNTRKEITYRNQFCGITWCPNAMQLGLSFKSNTYKLTVKGPEI